MKKFLVFVVAVLVLGCANEDQIIFEILTDKRDGNTYKVIKIGQQTWMAENLKYLPSISLPNESSDMNPHYYVYGYNSDNINEVLSLPNFMNFGVLYNHKAALNACPMGWHLPSDDEWKELELLLGINEGNLDNFGFRGENAGSKLAGKNDFWEDSWDEDGLDKSPEFGKSNFDALPGGSRNQNGDFSNLGFAGYWWTASTEYEYHGYYRQIFFQNQGIKRDYSFPQDGYSVRCIKD